MRTILGALFVALCSLGTQAESLDAQVDQILKSYLSAKQSANRCDELENMNFGITKSIQALNDLAKIENSSNVCRALQALDIETLTELSALIDKLDATQWPCAGRLATRIDNAYYIDQQVALDESSEDILQPALFGKNKKPKRKSSGQTQEVVIDNSRGGLVLPSQMQLPPGYLNLTFDDGPHATRTMNVLKILQDEGITANFFILGNNAGSNARVLQTIARLGHSVGTHSHTHRDLPTIGLQSAINDINNGFTAVANILGFVDPFFRFPYGSKNSRLAGYLRQQQITDFFWNVDTLDWKKSNPSTLLNYALSQTRRTGRGVVLFHDIHPQTVAVLPSYIRTLKSEGYKFVVFRAKVGQQLN